LGAEEHIVVSSTNGALAPRSHLAVLLGVLICWQVYVVVAAIVHSLPLGALLSGLSAEPPLITRVYLRTALFWPLAPVLSAVLAVDLLRRPAPSAFHSTAVVLVIAVLGFAMQAWANEAFFAPLLELMRKVG